MEAWKSPVKMGGVSCKISRLLELMNHLICACSVSIDAEIGEGTVFYHRGIGCVVHPKAVIGKDCKIFQSVTIGSKWSKANCFGEAPRIGNNVMIEQELIILEISQSEIIPLSEPKCSCYTQCASELTCVGGSSDD